MHRLFNTIIFRRVLKEGVLKLLTGKIIAKSDRLSDIRLADPFFDFSINRSDEAIKELFFVAQNAHSREQDAEEDVTCKIFLYRYILYYIFALSFFLFLFLFFAIENFIRIDR